MSEATPPPGVHRRIVVTGASGNVGSGVLRALARRLPDAQVVGVCRRPPTTGHLYERVHWHTVDLSAPGAAADLAPAMRGADVVIHLALAVQPARDVDYLYRANVLGTQAVLRAMDSAAITQLVYASSLGIYAPGSTHPVDETWPDTGQRTSTYSRHKVDVERMLDRFVRDHPATAVARFRPTVVVQREAASLIRSVYLGPLVPKAAFDVLRRRLLPVLPLPAGLALQFVHADDVGDAVVLMMLDRAEGSFNVAADVLDTRGLAALVGARPFDVAPRLMRAAVTALSSARLVALTPGWYDVATNSPLMDTAKIRRELGWAPTRSSASCARELIDGLAAGATGTSAATGWKDEQRMAARRTSSTIDRIHDYSLWLWSALALTRAVGFRRAGAPDVAVIAVNLVSGTPMALRRVRERRRDLVALAAPVAVALAVASTHRGGWSPVAATATLVTLGMAERHRTSEGHGQ
ncbi:NAD-dependent epimerase/dehydratase [Mycolicibacterium aurum]|uniref:NAD-dependent epimerase/dehydratase n=1 Tax=Mycolicibacterium aurum TaxID=1791 RepID=A0A3S4TUD3_MYCAU|nr:NAD-dependent epimerase/dehydratase family protein [Mycolicibacterium aurum]VEG52996.1 NAD-dependent epimerase/dehydratase [Mycolicibacterium aurum]